MPAITITDPFEANTRKIAILDQILANLVTYFPGHEPCGSVLSRYKPYLYFRGEPTIARIYNDITEIRFGILTPTPPDTRKKIFGCPIGEPPEPEVIGAVRLSFEETRAIVTEVKISVFGTQHKEAFVEFAHSIYDSLAGLTGKISVTVESQYPQDL